MNPTDRARINAIPLGMTLLADEDKILATLERAGICYVGQLAEQSDADLRAIKHWEQTWINAINATLSIYGLRRPGGEHRDYTPAKIWLQAKNTARCKARVEAVRKQSAIKSLYTTDAARVVSVVEERQDGPVHTYCIRVESVMSKTALEEKIQTSLG